jgi:hypothetical protein
MSPLTHMLKARVDPLTYQQIVIEAKRDQRSVGAVVRLALREHLEKKRKVQR